MTPSEISCQDLETLLADDPSGLLLVDCREPWEHEQVSIAGSTLIPMNDTPSRIEEYRAADPKEVVVYCHHGMRSLQVVGWLREQGLEGVRSLAGGIDAWSAAVDPSLARY